MELAPVTFMVIFVIFAAYIFSYRLNNYKKTRKNLEIIQFKIQKDASEDRKTGYKTNNSIMNSDTESSYLTESGSRH